jgi:glycosyltransferase involved in cell wall biosynthesis
MILRKLTPTRGIGARRIRLVHLNLSLNMGGAEKLLVEFARHADRRRFDLRFVSLGKRGTLADDIERLGWPVTALDEPEGLRKWLVLRLAWLLHSWRADVVHTHNTKAIIYGAPAARLARVPAVVHTRHGQRYQASRSDNAIFRFLTRLVDRVVCVSHDSAALSVVEGVAQRKITAIWNGIDVAKFAYLGPQPGAPVVMVGRLSSEKDVATLLRAAARIVPFEPRFQLAIAGDGECLPDLRHQAAALGLGTRVQFLGEVRDVPSLLARSSMLVLPSLTEGISLTLLEAMARGLPVVATRVGGNPEVVIDGETGYLVPPLDPASLAERMLELLRQPDLAAAMGRRGRARVVAHFQVSKMVARYESLYHDTLRSRGAIASSRFAEPRSTSVTS